MRPTRLLSIALLAAGAAFATIGCQEEDNSLDVDIDATEENLCSQYADVKCKSIFQCCTGAEIEANFGVKITTDEEQCRRDLQLVCEQAWAERLYAFENGTAVLDKETVDLCLQETLVAEDQCFPHMPASQMYPHCTELELLVIGQVNPENPCLYDFECAGDAYCDIDQICKEYPGRNQPCGNRGCAPGLYCTWDEVEEEDRCVNRAAAGEDCDWVENTDPPTPTTLPCLEDLVCVKKTAADAPPLTDGKCQVPTVVGETCTENRECETGNCLPGVCEGEIVGETIGCYDNDICWGSCSGDTNNRCQEADDCGGTCNGGNYDGENCNNNNQCAGNCENSFENCNVDADCTQMFCDVTGDQCDTLADCDAVLDAECTPDTCNGGGTCDTTQTCDKIPCAGEHICIETFETKNYCSNDGFPI